ncbi:MAG: hypothetical protein H0W21_00060 [Actinobacteria bacterium]|nr:hypothetical protein [Actinomycetota bacterium]
MWHLSYVVIGGCLAPQVDFFRLSETVAAFFLAVGVSAHALDELNGRPLGTQIPGWALISIAALGLTGAVVLGADGVRDVGPELVAFILAGVLLVLAYNLELWGGRLHNDVGFALAWGAFPVLVAYFAQADRIDGVAVLAAAGAAGLSIAQRVLSTPARRLRRRVSHVEGTVELRDGRVEAIDVENLLEPLERALRALSWATVALALAMLTARLL